MTDVYYIGCFIALLMLVFEALRSKNVFYKRWTTIDFFISITLLTLFSWGTIIILIKEYYLEYKKSKDEK